MLNKNILKYSTNILNDKLQNKILNKSAATKIICTLGPSTSSIDTIIKLAIAGMTIARINLSHTDQKTLINIINNVKYARNKIGIFIAIAIDTRGPEQRINIYNDLNIKAGNKIKFITNDEYNKINIKKDECILVGTNITDYSILKQDNIIKIDDAKFELTVKNSGKDFCIAIANNNYLLKNNKRIAFDNMEYSSMCKKDEDDIKLSIEHGADVIFLSFTESSNYILKIKKLIADDTIPIIAKIESQRAIDNLSEISNIADGLMIARGDLFTNIGIENAFFIQKKILLEYSSKPIIMATEMMQSMVYNISPTRAEVSDVGNAVFDGCCAVMLSSETSVGKYPVECVDYTRKICISAEKAKNIYKANYEKEERQLQCNICKLKCKYNNIILASNLSKNITIVVVSDYKHARCLIFAAGFIAIKNIVNN